MALSELYISPGRVERGGRGAMWGRRLTMNLGPQIFAWGKRKKEKKKKKTSSVNGISKYLLLCSRPGAPGGSGGRKNRQIKIKDKLLFCSFPLSKDTKQTSQRIRMRPCVAAWSRSRKWRGALRRGGGPGGEETGLLSGNGSASPA